MSHFHLRPVSELTRSTSPSTSSSTTSDRTPPPTVDSKSSSTITSPQVVSPTQPRRPLSPSSLRDVDLTQRRDVPRRYPPPPTGHDLMALFPPAPPSGICTGPTSGYFQREERAFFAQAGKEIVRVMIEVDMQQAGEPDTSVRAKSRDHIGVPRPWPQHNPLPPPINYHPPEQHSPGTRTPATPFPPPQNLPNDPQMPRRPPVTVTTQPIFPLPSHNTSPQPPYPVASSLPPTPHPPQHYMRTPSHEHPYPPSSGAHNDLPPPPDYDPDEAWRRPMPHSQRRRAGKHTKRVVVK